MSERFLMVLPNEIFSGATPSDRTWAISPAEAVSKLAPRLARRERTSCAGFA
jgi:hypothetical protein